MRLTRAPLAAPQNLGIDLRRMYYSQPTSGEEALEIMDELARSSAVDLVVVDSVAALVPRAELEGDIGQVTVSSRAAAGPTAGTWREGRVGGRWGGELGWLWVSLWWQRPADRPASAAAELGVAQAGGQRGQEQDHALLHQPAAQQGEGARGQGAERPQGAVRSATKHASRRGRAGRAVPWPLPAYLLRP